MWRNQMTKANSNHALNSNICANLKFNCVCLHIRIVPNIWKRSNWHSILCGRPIFSKRFVHQEYLLVMMISWLQNDWPCYSKSLWSIAFRCCQTKLYNSHIWRKCFRMSSSRSNSIIIKYLFNFIHHGHWLCYFFLIMLNIHTSKTNFDHQLYMYKLLLCTSL